MGRAYKFRDQDILHFVTIVVVEWVDLFIRDEYKEILLESLRHCQKNKGLEVYAWVIMPSHLHLIIGTSKNPMQDILRDFKSFTSRMLQKAIDENPRESRKDWILRLMKQAGTENASNNSWQLWQNGNHPVELTDNGMIEDRINYIHMNPVSAGFVDEPEYWRYSSAFDYSNAISIGDRGWLDLAKIE